MELAICETCISQLYLSDSMLLHLPIPVYHLTEPSIWPSFAMCYAHTYTDRDKLIANATKCTWPDNRATLSWRAENLYAYKKSKVNSIWNIDDLIPFQGKL